MKTKEKEVKKLNSVNELKNKLEGLNESISQKYGVNSKSSKSWINDETRRKFRPKAKKVLIAIAKDNKISNKEFEQIFADFTICFDKSFTIENFKNLTFVKNLKLELV